MPRDRACRAWACVWGRASFRAVTRRRQRGWRPTSQPSRPHSHRPTERIFFLRGMPTATAEGSEPAPPRGQRCAERLRKSQVFSIFETRSSFGVRRRHTPMISGRKESQRSGRGLLRAVGFFLSTADDDGALDDGGAVPLSMRRMWRKSQDSETTRAESGHFGSLERSSRAADVWGHRDVGGWSL